LTLYHAKVGGTKALTRSSIEECNQIIWGFIHPIHPRFVITEFRW